MPAMGAAHALAPFAFKPVVGTRNHREPPANCYTPILVPDRLIHNH